MDKAKVKKAIDLMHGVAEALRDTRLPVRERAAIARLLTLADTIDECKTDIEEAMQDDDGKDQQGGQLPGGLGGGQHRRRKAVRAAAAGGCETGAEGGGA